MKEYQFRVPNGYDTYKSVICALRQLFVLVFLTIFAFMATGCKNQYESKAMFFNGDVVVEYLQQSERMTKDYVTFKFYQRGEYDISFSLTKSGRGRDELPSNFSLTVDTLPREYIVEQKILPDFLTITIKRDGVAESKNFQ